MNHLQPLPTLHQLLDSAIKLDESLQRAIRLVRTMSLIDRPGDPNSPAYVALSSLLNLLMASVSLTVTLQLLTKQGVGNVSS